MSSLLISNFKMLEERYESDELKHLLKIIGNEEAELSPGVDRDGEKVQFIMIKPKTDGRIKVIE